MTGEGSVFMRAKKKEGEKRIEIKKTAGARQGKPDLPRLAKGKKKLNPVYPKQEKDGFTERTKITKNEGKLGKKFIWLSLMTFTDKCKRRGGQSNHKWERVRCPVWGVGACGKGGERNKLLKGAGATVPATQKAKKGDPAKKTRVA